MSKNVYVKNIEWDTTDEELMELFEPYGKVRSAQIIKDHVSKRSKGFGFVEMEKEDEASTAIEKLDGTELRGRTIKMNFARERKSRSF